MNKIVCPNCGAEYLADEIFISKQLLGDGKKVVKDAQGIIVSSIDLDTKEKYNCDFCHKDFSINAKIDFDVVSCETIEPVFVQELEPKLFMNED